MKKIFFIFIACCSFLETFAVGREPEVACQWLPWCSNGDVSWLSAETTTSFISKFIGYFIQYIAAIAVIYLMIAWIMYLLSGWDDEKVKKAKKSIIWALVWVFVSISAWAIIGIVNTFKIP